MKITQTDAKKFLSRLYGVPVTRLELLSGGEWSLAYGFEHEGQKKVVRFGQHVEDYLKDQAAAGLASSELPIPKVLSIGKAFDGYYAISERAEGTMIDYLNAEEMQAIVPNVLSVLDAIRSIKSKSAIVTKTMAWKDQLLSVYDDIPGARVSGWKEKLERSATGLEPFEQCYAKLRELLDLCPDRDDLLHNDLFHFNVLTTDGQISAVFDWGNTTRGDFLYELALLSYWAPWFPAMKGIDWERAARDHYKSIGLTVPNMDERLRCYKLHISLDAQKYCAFTDRWDEVAKNAKAGMALGGG